MDQQIEHLRLQGDRLAAAKQFAPFGVKRMVVEAKLHAALRMRSVKKKSSPSQGQIKRETKPSA
ncbi:MAG: hypothetical protein ACREC2_05710, partial [Bradyrhizobium sp.]